jgi:hypothetical protein
LGCELLRAGLIQVRNYDLFHVIEMLGRFYGEPPHATAAANRKDSHTVPLSLKMN